LLSRIRQQPAAALQQIFYLQAALTPPAMAPMCWRQYSAIGAETGSIERSIVAWHRSCEASRRVEEVPGIGPIVATAAM
jgi:transposase